MVPVPAPPYERALVWFRRDLRNFDHAALSQAMSCARAVYTAFVFDREILDPLPRSDRRVEFVRDGLAELDAALACDGGGVIALHGHPREAIPALARELGAQAVFVNRDYEPRAIARDRGVEAALATAGIAYHESKDQVIFERGEIVGQSGRPYSVFTPYRNAWLAALTPAHLRSHAVGQRTGALAPPPLRAPIPSLEALGFDVTDLRATGVEPGMEGGARLFAEFRERIDAYKATRDFPGVEGGSRLSVHLRFGTVSVRELASFAHARSLEPGGDGAHTWLSELIWRDFFAQVLWHRPDVVAHSYRAEYEDLRFANDADLFDAWCDGRTGYPIVDAAMRELNSTGRMHNRLLVGFITHLRTPHHDDQLRTQPPQRRRHLRGLRRVPNVNTQTDNARFPGQDRFDDVQRTLVDVEFHQARPPPQLAEIRQKIPQPKGGVDVLGV